MKLNQENAFELFLRKALNGLNKKTKDIFGRTLHKAKG